jgi:hypothetical protein
MTRPYEQRSINTHIRYEKHKNKEAIHKNIYLSSTSPKVMARETCYVYDISKSREHQRVVDRVNEFNMTKMTGAIILGQTTGCTTASNKT